ncbi:L-aspartate oxidase [Aeromicrobium marinum DSM 15272]|uniref:L-aspartate oxidase n=1 Tax=Aeromicrobium marinum DSM 15272 TaxID=585531 RepID=E2SCW3_9ACTN|nr:L-aspartate oxidase [Aeromicrobium marinum]EFQ83066.1 L-aspartate oxidase [Aeromicrobium marinum DSM 15272]
MTHLIVVGSGVAGLTCALEAAAAGFEVTLLAKARLTESNTRYAQGGVAVALADVDSPASHLADTLAAGAGLGDPDTAGILCAEGPTAIHELIGRGVQFDRDGDDLAHGLEAAHSHPRILHAGGDATGAGIAYALVDRVRAAAVTILEETTVVDLVVDGERVVGVRLLDGRDLRADEVVLATGGAGQLFPHTTNPEVATADGIAMALRAGAAVADLEFYQFHPTALVATDSFLVSEAVRGEGAVLLDAAGRRFMTDVHPDAELAPRDVVARGIAACMADQPGVPVTLDATALGPDFLARRFPTIDAACRARGWDWSTTPVPVAPAAHYFMGGVRTDAWGRTSVAGLWAVGEVACNGLHGANRLASNSLLEGAVYGGRVVEALLARPAAEPRDPQWAEPVVVDLADTEEAAEFTRADLQELMWDAVGLSRDAAGLAEARRVLRSWRAPAVSDVKSAEDANLLLVARAMVDAGAARVESRGGHFRTDAPDTDPAQALHSVLVPARAMVPA